MNHFETNPKQSQVTANPVPGSGSIRCFAGGATLILQRHPVLLQIPAPYSHSLAGSPEWGSELDFLRSGIPVGIAFSDSGTTVLKKNFKKDKR